MANRRIRKKSSKSSAGLSVITLVSHNRTACSSSCSCSDDELSQSSECLCKDCIRQSRIRIMEQSTNQAGRPDNLLVHLYQENEELKKQMAERERHIVQLENAVMSRSLTDSTDQDGQLLATIKLWQEKYDRLFDSHRKLQKVNHSLEDKLLKVVDKFETERETLTSDITDLTNKLVEARLLITELEEENEGYKTDCAVAVNLIQCKPSNFVPHRLSTLPSDLQERVQNFLSTGINGHRRSKSSPTNGGELFRADGMVNMGPNGVSQSSSAKVIRVPISTFPPTAMVYSINKVQQQHSSSYATETAPKQADYVSAAIMAKVLEERTKERNMKNTDRIQKCAACRSKRSTVPYYDQGTQTPIGTLTEDDFLTHPFDLTSGQDFYERTFTISRDLSMDDSSVNQHSLSGLSPWPASFAISMPSNQQSTRIGMQSGNAYSFKDQLSEDSHTYFGLASKKSETMII